LEDAAVLAWHVQQQGLTEAALRAYEKERIPRVKEIFSLGAKQAEAMAKGVSQRDLLDARAELLYGQAKFRPLQPVLPAVSAMS
jgi:2-polyprenyl-6-methoxyphenol hydroxylase-like FAD-dependent oxidoreductase